MRVSIHLDRRQTVGDDAALRMARELEDAGARVKLHDELKGQCTQR